MSNFIYGAGDAQVTPNLGLATWGMDEVLAENMILLDTAIGSGSSVRINSTVIPNVNFVNSASAVFSVTGSNVSITASGSGSTAWSSLTNPTANLSLSMIGDTSTFNYTSPASAFTWANITPATAASGGAPPAALGVFAASNTNALSLAIVSGDAVVVFINGYGVAPTDNGGNTYVQAGFTENNCGVGSVWYSLQSAPATVVMTNVGGIICGGTFKNISSIGIVGYSFSASGMASNTVVTRSVASIVVSGIQVYNEPTLTVTSGTEQAVSTLGASSFIQAVITTFAPTFGDSITSAATFSSTYWQQWSVELQAVAAVSQNSPSITLAGQFWNGSASAVSEWTIQGIITNVNPPNDTLTIKHTGMTGLAFVSVPNLALPIGGIVVFDDNAGISALASSFFAIGNSIPQDYSGSIAAARLCLGSAAFPVNPTTDVFGFFNISQTDSIGGGATVLGFAQAGGSALVPSPVYIQGSWIGGSVPTGYAMVQIGGSIPAQGNMVFGVDNGGDSLQYLAVYQGENPAAANWGWVAVNATGGTSVPTGTFQVNNGQSTSFSTRPVAVIAQGVTGQTGDLLQLLKYDKSTVYSRFDYLGNLYVPSINNTGTYTDAFSSVGTYGQLLSSTITGTKWITAGSGAGVIPVFGEYTLSVVGGTISATNNTTGHVDYTGTDAAVVVNNVLAALATTGGLLFFKNGIYPINSLTQETISTWTNVYYGIGIPASSLANGVIWRFEGESMTTWAGEAGDTAVQNNGVIFNVTPTAISGISGTSFAVGVWQRPYTIGTSGFSFSENYFKQLSVRFPVNTRGYEIGFGMYMAGTVEYESCYADFNVSFSTLSSTTPVAPSFGFTSSYSSAGGLQHFKDCYSSGYQYGFDIQSEHFVSDTITSIYCTYAGIIGRGTVGTPTLPSSNPIFHPCFMLHTNDQECTNGWVLGGNITNGNRIDMIGYAIEVSAMGAPAFARVNNIYETNSGYSNGHITFSQTQASGGLISTPLFSNGGIRFVLENIVGTSNLTFRYTTQSAMTARLTGYFGDSGGNIGILSSNVLFVPGGSPNWQLDDSTKDAVLMTFGRYSGAPTSTINQFTAYSIAHGTSTPIAIVSINSTNTVEMSETVPLQWDGPTAGTPDTDISRISSGTIGIGTGAQGSIAGNLSYNRINTAGADHAGQATVTAGQTTKAVSFANNYTGTGQPVIVLTPTSDPLALGVPVGYWVTYTGSAGAWSGFSVNVQTALAGNIVFNYVVVGVA